ncbi:MAG: Holliday junction branch migration protein RuvA [Firmicutes bacterium HGW-Firmicutes-14]|nr:MAG: Holliday junction branch migration protein RuvA [Firmicutes bacterium HGW-Firmicutes-14]
MIAFIKGQPFSAGTDYIIIDVNGVGYRVNVPTSVVSRVAGKKDDVTIYTYMHVREDAMQLFGFIEESDRAVFELLIQVSGIGPRVALGILSSINTPALVQAVINEQVNILTGISGIGKKMAQRIIVELKDKFSKMGAAEDTGLPGSDAGTPDQAGDALQALTALGYNPAEARRALAKAASEKNSSIGLEEMVRLALKELGRQ